jgi:hypothetical protein
LREWFDFKVPKTSIAPDFIQKAIDEPELVSANAKPIWLGKTPQWEIVQKSKKGSTWEQMQISFQTQQSNHSISVEPDKGAWLLKILHEVAISKPKQKTIQELKADYEANGLEDFELFWDNKPVNALYKAGLLLV